MFCVLFNNNPKGGIKLNKPEKIIHRTKEYFLDEDGKYISKDGEELSPLLAYHYKNQYEFLQELSEEETFNVRYY